MKKLKKSAARAAFPALKALAVVLALSFAAPAFAQPTPVSEITGAVGAFSERLAHSLPLNASLGLNWSSAWMGQLIGVPPHFGVGISGGLVAIPINDITGLISIFNASLPYSSVFPSPAYTVEGRIGGIFLPFDIGLKAGWLPPVGKDDILFDFLLLGGDIRYAIVKEGLVAPAVSVGFGVSYLSGGIHTTIGSPSTYTGSIGTHQYSIDISAPKLDFTWETTVFELKGQVSKNFVLFTPYAGLGFLYARTSAGFSANASPSFGWNGGDANADQIGQIKEASGLDFNDNGFSQYTGLDGFSMRFFGGLAFNMALFKIDITALAATGNQFSFGDMTFGVSLGFRFQI